MSMKNQRITVQLRYFLLAVLFWVVVDYTTAFNPNLRDWVAHMPLIWLFYTAYPALFAFLIFNRRWSGGRLFAAMICAASIVELPLCHNTLLTTFPILLLMIPLAIAIYTLITFVPKWIVEGKLRNNKAVTMIVAVVWFFVALLSYRTRMGG
jgi:hypothetical protein